MATDTTTSVVEKDEKREALEAKEAQEGFAAGFERVAGKPDLAQFYRGTQDTEGKAAPAADEAAGKEKQEAPAADKAAQAPAVDPWEGVQPVVRQQLEELKKLPQQIRNLAGNIGGLKSQFESAGKRTSEAGGQAPSTAEAQAAFANPAAWKQLKEDFPDWAGPIEQEFAAIKSQLKSRPAGEEDPVARARNLAYVDYKHEGWEETVRAPQFSEWLGTQPNTVRELADSKVGRDAVKLLDLYADHKSKAAATTAARERNDKRLQAGLTPQGTSQAPSTGLDDEAAFKRGFNRVAKARL